MLRKYAQAFVTLLFLADLFLTAVCWILAYYLRFRIEVIPVTRGYAALREYLMLLPIVLLICGLTYRASRLYVPRREGRFAMELLDLLKANIIVLLVFTTATFFYGEKNYSRALLAIFLVLNTAALAVWRLSARSLLRYGRRRGWNVRYALVIGAGRRGQELVERFRINPWMGINVIGFLDDDEERQGKHYQGVPVIGRTSDIRETLRQNQVDQVFLALPMESYPQLKDIVEEFSEELSDIHLVLDLPAFALLNQGVSDYDGIPVMHLRQGPHSGWDYFLKRLVDIVFALVALIVFSPVLLVCAFLVKKTSRGPVFYRQERMGLDGHRFQMLKFRTMATDAEKDSGPVWARPGDARRTSIGSFLRRTSLDEFPQFLNVLKGDMSIVGPRPERPVFIQEFKSEIPRYMLRHKAKPGITGWAQVNGWRGDTSLKKRIQYDLYYIQNWTIWFDLRIMALTVVKGLVNPNAY